VVFADLVPVRMRLRRAPGDGARPAERKVEELGGRSYGRGGKPNGGSVPHALVDRLGGETEDGVVAMSVFLRDDVVRMPEGWVGEEERDVWCVEIGILEWAGGER
jgi:hypothetical protein